MAITEPGLIELSNLLHSLSEKIGAKDGNEDLERETERHLQAIRDSFKRILKYGQNDVFVRYLMEQIESFATVCLDAAGKSVLRVTEHQFKSAQLLLDAFGQSERVVRYTWKISPGQRLFEDDAWRNYFELSSSLAISGAMEIRAMLIMEERRACDEANIRKLLEFFASEENLNAKIVLNADWDTFVVDYAIPSNCIEFGIFGTNLLYQTNTYMPVSLGSWSKDPVEIGRYTRFFEAIWNASTIAAANPASLEQKVRLSEVMAVDSAVERRRSTVQNAVHDRLTRIEESIKSEVA